MPVSVLINIFYQHEGEGIKGRFKKIGKGKLFSFGWVGFGRKLFLLVYQYIFGGYKVKQVFFTDLGVEHVFFSKQTISIFLLLSI